MYSPPLHRSASGWAATSPPLPRLGQGSTERLRRQTLLDERALSRPYVTRAGVERIVNGHCAEPQLHY